MYQAPKGTLFPARRARAGAPLDLARVALVVRAELRPRWKLFAGVAAVLALGAFAAAPREFTSKAVLLWEGMPGEARDQGRELRTVADSVKTPANLAEVKKRLGLKSTLDGLARQIDVTFAERSNLITLGASGKDAPAALALADQMLAVFLEQRVLVEKTRKERLAQGLLVAVDSAETDLAERRAAWDDFCRTNEVEDLPRILELALNEEAHLSVEQISARAEAEAEGGRADSLTKSAATEMPAVVLTQKVVSPTSSRLADVESELAGLRNQLSPDHPRVLALKAQAKSLRAHPDKPGQEVATERSMGRNPQWDLLQGSLIEARAREDAAQRRAAALANLSKASKQKLAELNDIEGRGRKLALALKAAEVHLTDVRQRRAQALDEARAPGSGLSVLSAPALASGPSKSSRKSLVLLALLLALLIPPTVVLIRTLRGLRIHTAVEAAYWGRGPVVSSLGWPSAGPASDLELELGRAARASEGTTLLVAFGALERPLLEEAALALGCPLLSSADEVAAADGPLLAFAGDADELRRAVRLVDRAVVLLQAGARSAFEVALEELRFDESCAIGWALVDAGGLTRPRCGEVAEFWGKNESTRVRSIEFAQRRAN